MRYVVDRIESGTAVCNCMSTGADLAIGADELPQGTREGDVLEKTADGYVRDVALTGKRLAELTARMDRLFGGAREPTAGP